MFPKHLEVFQILQFCQVFSIRLAFLR